MKRIVRKKAWRRKKYVRLLSVILCFCLLITSCPNMPGAVSVSAAEPRAAAAALHPQTLMVTTDNENNAHTGTADGDMDNYLHDPSLSNLPIEVSFTLNELPTQSAYLAIKAYDVDEESMEWDYVYVNDDIYKPMDRQATGTINRNPPNQGEKRRVTWNDSNIGRLAGTNETWNVTVLEVPLEKLVKGKNVISIAVAQDWAISVDWMQLVLDGGAADSNLEAFSLKLKDAATAGGNVTVHSDVTIKQKGNTKYETEYTLTQESTGNALDACFGSAVSKETVGLTMPFDSPTGTYKITGILKDPNTQEIKAIDNISFYFMKNVGMGPKVSHTLTPDVLTNQNVTIKVKAEAAPGVTNVSVSPASYTAAANGTYDKFTVNYMSGGKQRSFTYSAKVDNIDKTPPSIAYTPITVLEDTPYEEVAALFKKALSVTDDRKLAENPLNYTLPVDISNLPGGRSITVKATDTVGNIATKACTVNVTAKPMLLTMKKSVAVSGSKDSFALKAFLEHPGADTITETGFVWGVMPNPTMELKNGAVKTASVVQTKGSTLSATATGITPGVEYHARAYAKVKSGSQIRTVYSDVETFGFGIPDYGKFSVSKVSGSTFTITRTGGSDGRQTVYYRTVNGSAIGGTHFTHASGTVVFENGQTSKTVTVSEKGVTTAYGSKAATSYSNADRTYSFEIYRVDGGGKLDGNKANCSKTRIMKKNSGYTVRRTLYTAENQRDVSVNDNNKWVADNTGKWWRKVVFINDWGKNPGNGNKNFNVQRTMEVGNGKENAYLKETAEGFFYKLKLSMTETDSGYEHVWISNHAPNSLRGPESDNHTDYESIPLDFGSFGHAFYTGRWEAAYHKAGSATASFPSESGLRKNPENPYRYRDNSRISGDWVLFNINETAHVWFAANGNKKNMWYVNSYTDWLKIRDTKEPKCIGVAPMAGGTYLPDDPVTVALIFDEIVDETNSGNLKDVSINTSVGTLKYAGGVNTNVLYFTGNVQTGSSLNGSSALKVTKINNSGNIKDMCDGGSTTPSYSGSTNISVDASKPSVTITANTSGSLPRHKMTVKSSENTVQYTWTKSTVLPATGWQTLSGAASGKTLTENWGTAGKSETWYLHVLATASSGASTHTYKAFTFMHPDITGVSVRADASTSSADVSDTWKNYKHIAVQYAGAQTSGTNLTFAGPQTSTQTITTASGAKYLKVTQNGVYTLTLTDSYGNVITKMIEVKKIDTEKPTATMRSGSQTGTEVTHNSVTAVITPADTGGSGVAKVEYVWTGSASVPSSGWTVLNKEADGSYQTTYDPAETVKTQKYLHVRVTDGAGNVSSVVHSGPYQVIKKATGNALPKITVTGNPASWTKSANLQWTVTKGTGTGAGEIKYVTVPAQNTPVTGKTSGTCSVTKNGNYLFSVMDTNGNTVSTMVTVTKLDVDAPTLDNITATGGKSAKITLTGVTDNLTCVLDENGNFKEMSGSGIKTREYQLEGTGSWTTFTGDSFSPSKNGTYTVKLTDNVGNSSQYKVTLADFDKTVPGVTCKINATKNATGWYTTYPLPVELTYNDPAGTEGGASGIASVQYKWITGSKTTPTTGLTNLNAAAVAGGKYTVNLGYYDNAEVYYLYYKVTDKTGNVTEGFSDAIKKDSYKGSAAISGPDKGQPVADGLEMKLNSLVYGPSGGRLTGGTASSATTLVTMPGHAAGQKTYSGTPGYTAKTPGNHYFRLYPTAAGGSSYYWAFYVRKVTFDSQGGSAEGSQLVWHDSTSNVKCTVTEPSVPTRTGYTFGGWYTDAACTSKFDFTTQVRKDTTLYAKWTANTYTVTYHMTQPTSTTEYPIDASYKTYTYGKGLTLPVPATTRSGFVFDGWYENANYTGKAYQSISGTAYGNKEYYGRFKDVQAPTVTLSHVYLGKGDEGWYGNAYGAQSYISVYVGDNRNTNESDLFMKWDDGEFISLGKCKATPQGSSQTRMLVYQSGSGYVSGLWPEGEHTLTFKIVDVAGNEGFHTSTFKWDASRPVMGNIDYGTAGTVKDNGITYLCGKKEVVLSVPMSDSVSGVNMLKWSQREKGSTKWTNEEMTLSGEKEETAKLTFGTGSQVEFRDVYGRDKAKNSMYTKDFAAIEIGGESYNTYNNWTGIIVEDTAPTITLTDGYGNPLSEDWYESAPEYLKATVKDGGADGTALTSGIKSITYTINGYTYSPKTYDTLTSEGEAVRSISSYAGVKYVTVTAEDHAGNTASTTVVLKIKGMESTPIAKADYPADELCNLVPNAKYKITVGGTAHTVTTDKDGRIPFVLTGEEGGAGDMCGKTIYIVRTGFSENGVTYTTASNPQPLSIAARPAKIDKEKIAVTPELAQDAENAIINLEIQDVAGTKEYSVDDKATWTDVPGNNEITNLKPGSIIVRVKATNEKPHGLSSEPKTIDEGSQSIHAAFNLNYENAAGVPATVESLTGKSTVAKPADPSREGYEFKGWYMEPACVNEWRFTGDAIPHQVKEWRKDGTQTTFDPPTVDEALTIILYAKWRETTPPELTPKLTTGAGGTETADGTNWYHNLTLTADYSDNVAVTRLSVSVDGGDYKELDIGDLTPDAASNPVKYHCTCAVLEGAHTYRFKAEDAAGNVTESGTVTAKLDKTNPVLGEADFSQGYHSFWDWIVRNESLQITVPVEDKSAGSGIEMSGIESVKYALTPADGTEQAEQSAELSDNNTMAAIQIAPDFKGTIRITAYDNAGNTVEKTIGADGSGINGVIVEDKAPVITILADREVGDDSSTKTEDAGVGIATDYYNAAPRLYVKVTDDKAADNNALITSGLKSVTWKIGNGAEHQSGMNFETGTIKTTHSFTISSLEGMTGKVSVTVKAVDQAGNETAVTKDIYIKTKEKQPEPKIDYRKEILTNLVKNAKYKVLGTDGNEEEITADRSGHIKIREEWFGREVQICKAGTSTTLDSTKTDVKPAARPAPPKTEAKKAETVKSQADGIIGASDDASDLDMTTLEYSTDDGKSWKPVTERMLTDGKMQNCASGAWLFRVPACDTAPYGEKKEVIIGAGKALTVSFEENGGSEVAEITDLSWHDKVAKPEDPVRQGYAFEGWYQEAGFENIWHFKGETPETAIENDITLHAKWRDKAAPAISAVLTNPRSNGSADGEQWYNNLLAALTYSDNEKVTALYVGVDLDSEAEKDDSRYTALSLDSAVQAGKGTDGSVRYRIYDDDLKEGEHTYTFKAVDAAGNETMTRLNARLDSTAPEMGTASYEMDAANRWNWIIKKDSLIITVPVTDNGKDGKPGSGVETVDYNLLTVTGGTGGLGSGMDSLDSVAAVVTGTAKVVKVKDGEFTAEITVPADFKGKVKVAAKDKAGNTAAEKTLGVDGNGKNGIIVEDNAPDIHFGVDGGEVAQTYYETAPQVDVSVDDKGWVGEQDGTDQTDQTDRTDRTRQTGRTKDAALTTGGIASVTCSITNGSRTASYTPETDYTAAMKESDSFALPADKLFTGINIITVTVRDYAGNTAQKQVQVKVKTPEDMPEATIGYVAETLNGLEPDAEYRIADVGMKTDAKGSVSIEESWIGTTISVVRMGSAEIMTESAPQSLPIPARPEAPVVTITNETYPDAGDGILTMTETDKMYQFSLDGVAWTDAETDENKRITGLLAKDYYVRARAVENQSFHSKEAKVFVGTTPPTPYETPETKIDYRKETLSGLVPDAEYIIEYDSSTGKPDVGEENESVVTVILKTDENGNIPVEKEWLGQKLSIVRKGNGKEKSDSAEQLLDLPVRPGAPNPAGVNETGVHTQDAKLTNLTADTAYDISKDGGESWTKKTADAAGEIKGVDAPAEYIVRAAATDSSFSGFASTPVEVDGYHIPVIFVANGVTCGTSWTYYGKGPEKIPPVPEKADAGGRVYVGEWCIDENGTPADLANITNETTLYACYTLCYNIILQGGAGYTLTAQEGSTSPVKEGGSFTFKFTLSDGYEKTGSFAVKVNGASVALKEDGTYTIGNIKQDYTVTAEGIKPSGPSDDPGKSGRTGNEIEKRKDLSILLAAGKQKGSTGIKLTWSKWKDASGYEVYWSYCDGKNNFKKLKTVKAKAKRTYIHKKRKKNRAYKYYIAAYKMVNGKKKYVAKTPIIHVAMKYEKCTNAKKITLNKTKLVLSLTNKKYKKTCKIRAKIKKENSKKKLLTHAAELRYYTDNKKVAKVSRTGKITARGRGKCTVYVIAINGVCKKMTVTVK